MPWFALPYFAEKMKREGKTPFFIQIGAMDGKTDDPIHNLVRAYGWHGLLVEPLRDHFERLQANYEGCKGLVFENCAIADETGERTMYRIPTALAREKGLPRWALQAGSLHPDRNALGWDEIRPLVVEEKVPCLTLPDLLEKHRITDFQVLQMDAEGYDYPILKQLDLDRFQPKIINLEVVNMTDQEFGLCRKLLDQHHYLYSKTGYDLLAIRTPF